MCITVMTPAQLRNAPYIEKSNYVLDLLAMTLPSAQAQIVTFIARRTLRWEKDREIIPLDHFEDGITNSKTGEWVIHGLKMARTTIVRALKALVSSGWVGRVEVKTPHGNTAHAYEFNWEKIAMAFLPKPKQAKAQEKAQKAGQDVNRGAKWGTRGSGMLPPSGSAALPPSSSGVLPKGTHINDQRKTSKTARKRAAVRSEDTQEENSPEGLTGGISEAIAAGVETTKRSALKRINRPVSAKVLEDIWQHQLSQSWEGVVHTRWTGKWLGMAKNLIKEIGRANVKEFVEWSVQNWRLVKVSKFGPKREVDMPDMPDFGFLYAFRSSFIAVWNDREFMRRVAGDPKAGLMVWLRNQGYTEEDALEEAGQRDLHKQRKAELEADRKEIEALQRQLGVVYSPKRGIKQHAKDAEARIANSQKRKSLNPGSNADTQADDDTGGGSALRDRFSKIGGWDE